MKLQSIKLFSILILISALTFKSNAAGIRRYSRDLNENDICGLNPKIYNGKCKKISKCMNVLAERKKIEICRFGEDIKGEDALICCSREDFYKSRRYSKEGVLDFDACLQRYKFYRSTDNSAQLAQFAVNGVDVEPFEFSHIAAIGWLSYTDFSVAWNCGGNLITESYVMSAAHCSSVDGRKPNVVRLGDTDLNSPFDDIFVQQFGVHSVIQHPDYDYDSNLNDIALIRLRGRVFPTRYVVPACLNFGRLPTEYFEGAGYGQDGEGLRKNKLSKVQLKFVEMEKCQESYSIPLSGDTQICAEGYREDLVQDLCYGDSGSALQIMNTDMKEGDVIYKVPTLVAITSFGIGCAFGFPSVYVNASYYIDWMESVISP